MKRTSIKNLEEHAKSMNDDELTKAVDTCNNMINDLTELGMQDGEQYGIVLDALMVYGSELNSRNSELTISYL